MWQKRALALAHGRAKRERPRTPLILSGHGVRLRIDNNALVIRNGLTHYPQYAEEWRFFPGDLTRPSRIILLDGSGIISFDVLSWLANQDISLVRINWQGEIVCKGHVFDPADFVIRSDGVCRLNPEMARCVVAAVARDWKLSGRSTVWEARA